jgi:GalNAc-alpha-(1->4)-GalNAc-alpha-(1->3)-diNAcBac-PP-undecaprenol alpha-1,4-N-acetyl-D-galactosaminyltransferase
MSPPVEDRQVTMVIHALSGGGAERVFCSLANHWAESGRDVTAITLDTAQNDVFHLDPRVRRIGLGMMQPSRTAWQQVSNTLKRVRGLRRAIRESGASRVVSFTDKMNVLTLLACWGGPWQVVIAERSDPRHQSLGPLWEWLRRRTYPRCCGWVVQTESVARYARTLAGLRPVIVIPNAVTSPAAAIPPPEQRPTRIVGMGRLSPEKGFDVLVRAFARIAPWYPDWTLRILGAGPQREQLEDLADSLGVRDNVHWAGWVDWPESALLESSVFVLPSRYEGFPNALLEAMACGLSCVASACESGPAEIIRDGVDGLLVPPDNVDALADALRQLVSDEAKRARLGRRAVEVTSRFSPEAFFARWDEVLCLPDRVDKGRYGGTAEQDQQAHQ